MCRQTTHGAAGVSDWWAVDWHQSELGNLSSHQTSSWVSLPAGTAVCLALRLTHHNVTHISKRQVEVLDMHMYLVLCASPSGQIISGGGSAEDVRWITKMFMTRAVLFGFILYLLSWFFWSLSQAFVTSTRAQRRRRTAASPPPQVTCSSVSVY